MNDTLDDLQQHVATAKDERGNTMHLEEFKAFEELFTAGKVHGVVFSYNTFTHDLYPTFSGSYDSIDIFKQEMLALEEVGVLKSENVKCSCRGEINYSCSVAYQFVNGQFVELGMMDWSGLPEPDKQLMWFGN